MTAPRRPTHEPLFPPQSDPTRGAAKSPRPTWTLKFGRREVCTARREVLVDGRPRPLQPRAFDVLVYLIENRERVVTTGELLDTIWRNETVQQGSLAAAIARVRRALLDDQRDNPLIRTHQRVGYRFVGGVDAAS